MANLTKEQTVKMVKAYKEYKKYESQLTKLNETVNAKLSDLKNCLGLTTNDRLKVEEAAVQQMGSAYLNLDHDAL